MTDYDFILNEITYSFSSVTTFENCPYGFKLAYIDAESREDNYWGQRGSLMHEVLEKYYSNELDFFELSEYYRKRYGDTITTTLPPFIKTDYFSEDIKFLDNLYFDMDQYEIIKVEEKQDLFLSNGTKATYIADLILKDLTNNEIVIVDHKTANPFKNKKLDKKKMIGYEKQLNLYAFFVERTKNILVDRLEIWFTKKNYKHLVPCTETSKTAAHNWFINSIEKIKNETEFAPNQKKSNKFFCQHLCGTGNICTYRPK